MKKLFFFLSGIACIVGIVLMYTGYCKAQGEFWGRALCERRLYRFRYRWNYGCRINTYISCGI